MQFFAPTSDSRCRLESCPPLLRCRTPPPRRPPLFPPTVFCAKRALVAKIDARRRSSLHRRRKIFLQLRFRSSRRRGERKNPGPLSCLASMMHQKKSYICILKLLLFEKSVTNPNCLPGIQQGCLTRVKPGVHAVSNLGLVGPVSTKNCH